MLITSEIFKGVRNVGRSKTVSVEFYKKPTQLFQELNQSSIIENLKLIPLLGDISISKNETYSRYDYVMMQIYIYQFVKSKLNGELKPTLNNSYKVHEFSNAIVALSDIELGTISIAEILQILAIICNIGHFKNTFTSSRGFINAMNSSESILNSFLDNFEFIEHRNRAKEIIKFHRYHEFHMLNSILLLQSLDRGKVIVKFCLNLVTEYLKPSSEISQKSRYIFKLYKSIREICYITLDLSIAPIPIHLDIRNDKHLTTLLKERLAEFNNPEQIDNIFQGLGKLLQDTVYHQSESVLIQFDISRRMMNQILRVPSIEYELNKNYLQYTNFFQAYSPCPLNKKYARIKDFDEANILKLTFKHDKQDKIIDLCDRLNRFNFVKAAWYYRLNERKVTLLISVKKNDNHKVKTSFKIFAVLMNYLYDFQENEIDNNYHTHILLTTKFFLYYLMDGNKIKIEGKLNPDVCVLLDRGNRKRLKKLNNLIFLSSTSASVDELHEIEFLRNILNEDKKNDLAMTVSSSILVKDKTYLNKDLAEFDGMIIYPNRISDQIVFVESKNTREKPLFSKKCLKDKFDSLHIDYNEENFISINKDCKYYFSI